MKNRLNFVLVVALLFLLTACAGVEPVVEIQTEKVEKSESGTPDMATPENDASEVAIEDETDEVEDEVVTEELDALISTDIDNLAADEDLKGLWSYLQEILPDVNRPTAEYALIAYMTLAESQLYSMDDPLFTDVGYEMQNSIYDIYEANEDAFEFGHLMVGEDKYLLYDKMAEVHKPILKDVLDEGYGLINMEGSFYRIVDYKELYESYGQQLSDMSEAYLDIQASILVKQTTVEEYLLLTPIELMNRSILLESYLMTFPEMPQLYNDMMTRHLNIALYKLSLPTPFDGSVEEDGTLSDDFKAMYEMVLEQAPTPVVTQVVKEFTTWVESRERGYIGTYMDTEELFEISGEIYGRATEKVTELYK